MVRHLLAALAALVLVAGGCGDDAGDGPSSEASTPATTATPETTTPPAATPVPTDTPPAGDGLYPDVLAAEAALGGDGTWSFSVTLSSPYDSPERYADAWRVLAPDGSELGVRELLHDHAGEQPFTRSLSGVEIPDDVTTVTIEGRDQRNGWGGATVTISLPR